MSKTIVFASTLVAIVIAVVPGPLAQTRQDNDKAAADAVKNRTLPLVTTRTLSFTTSEGTWPSLLMGAWPGAQSTPFAGRWRQADVSPAPNAAAELLVTIAPSMRMSVERKFGDGARYANFTIVSSKPGVERRSDALLRDGSLVLKTPAALQVAVPPAGSHEEVWKVTADDVLIVDVTDEAIGRAPARTRMTYRRVPRPASVPPNQNLLENATADRGKASWFLVGDARIDPCGGNPCFAVRNGGSFHQTVILPADAAGKYLVMVGSGTSERVNPDGGITGLPTLYGLVGTEDGVHIVGHLQGMLGRATVTDSWIAMSGVFRIPDDAHHLSFQLNQASARGTPHNGSAARYDDLGAYIFATEIEARTFASNWRGRSY